MIPCLGQTHTRLYTLFRIEKYSKKPYPVQGQDRAISRMGFYNGKAWTSVLPKIISLQNQNITECQDCNWLAQVIIVHVS